MPYQIYNRPIVDPGAIAAGQQFAAPFGRAREVADANQRRREDIARASGQRREDIARASGQRSEDIQRALDTQGFNVMQATLERAKIKLTPVQQPVLGADGKTTMQTTYQQAPRDPAEVNQIMTQQFGAGWEARMQSISQKLGMYGEGQPAPVAPPGTTPGTTPREQPTPPITGANTTQGEGGWGTSAMNMLRSGVNAIGSKVDTGSQSYQGGPIGYALDQIVEDILYKRGRKEIPSALTPNETGLAGVPREPEPRFQTAQRLTPSTPEVTAQPTLADILGRIKPLPISYAPEDTEMKRMGRLTPLDIPGMPTNIGNFTAQRVAGALARKKQLEEMGRLRPLPISYAPEPRRRPSLSQGSGYRNW